MEGFSPRLRVPKLVCVCVQGASGAVLPLALQRQSKQELSFELEVACRCESCGCMCIACARRHFAHAAVPALGLNPGCRCWLLKAGRLKVNTFLDMALMSAYSLHVYVHRTLTRI